MNNKVAFACPLYDMKNHFDLALDLYGSKIENKIEDDFYFVFSNLKQKDKFESLVNERWPQKDFRWLITTEEINKCKAKAVSKKFYALETLKDDYDYIILVDCESLFIKHCDYGALAEQIWEKRSMLNANKSLDGYLIMRKCFKTLGVYNNELLRKDTLSFRYNFWFNELQVYKCNNLDEFFIWLNCHNKTKVYDEYLCFEYYVYYAFLLIEKGIHINKFNFESMGGINEYLFKFTESKQKEIMNTMGLHWTSSRDAINENVVMLFHLDRENSNDYSPTITPVVRIEYFIKKLKCYIKDLLHYD